MSNQQQPPPDQVLTNLAQPAEPPASEPTDGNQDPDGNQAPDGGTSSSSVVSTSSATPEGTPSLNSTTIPTNTGDVAPPHALTVGQAVGVGIGSAIAGALLVLVAALIFLFKKRRKNPRERHHHTESPPDLAALDHLAQPLAHETIRRDMRSLQTGIKNFVDNYFHPEQAIIDATGEAKIVALAGEPNEGSSWSDALGNLSLQPLIIRTIISRSLFAMIHPLSDGDWTLLPPDFKGAYQSLNDTGPSSRVSIDTSQRTQLLSLWRRISGQLLPSHDRLDQSQVEGVAAELATALAPLRPRQTGNYHSVLRGLVTSATRLGVSLFEQPHEWQAVWKTSSSHGARHGVVVFPGLVFLVEGQPSGKSQGFEGMERLRVCKVVVEE